MKKEIILNFIFRGCEEKSGNKIINVLNSFL